MVGEKVGGRVVGCLVGNVGDFEGNAVGDSEGEKVGDWVGRVGDSEGEKVGDWVGRVGDLEGETVGDAVGRVGDSVGDTVGEADTGVACTVLPSYRKPRINPNKNKRKNNMLFQSLFGLGSSSLLSPLSHA